MGRRLEAVYIPEIKYGDGIDSLRQNGIDFFDSSARRVAEARVREDSSSTIHRLGAWCREEVIYSSGDVYLLTNVAGPSYRNHHRAAFWFSKGLPNFYYADPLTFEECKDKGEVFELAVLLSRDEEIREKKSGSPLSLYTFPFPPNIEEILINVEDMAEIDTLKLNCWDYYQSLPMELQLAARLFGDKTRSYAVEVLLRGLITKLRFIVRHPYIKKRGLDYSMPLWIGSTNLTCKSVITGCICGNWMFGFKTPS